MHKSAKSRQHALREVLHVLKISLVPTDVIDCVFVMILKFMTHLIDHHDVEVIIWMESNLISPKLVETNCART